MLRIHEIYKSIQGESTYAGLPCIFVRLTGCNLRCQWCDTTQAFYGGVDKTVEAVLEETERLDAPLVEITGGEPLLQAEVYPLMQSLLDRGQRVLLETSGSLSIEKVPQAVVKIVDMKCPASGEAEKNHYDNLKLLAPHDEVKFVIADRKDYEWSRDLVKQYALHSNPVLFSPVFDQLAPRTLAEWILEDKLQVRLQSQLHKIIWDKNAVGV
ncbi:MAG: radical SAM protein [Candidatus Nitrohelix vancouverensis]|uniref:7-carboxy-7-deazaguanine synthase n=1 Tax=Candidatus Nitrohelix vancouverensis TaxID=2705534 RepID=A0A7T0C579_9BACT|nr:MAG: radical SAM protein [Candidatus Nitrohelix vancouverensis]